MLKKISEEDIQRYAHQIILKNIGIDGQKKLLTSKVFIPRPSILSLIGSKFKHSCVLPKIINEFIEIWKIWDSECSNWKKIQFVPKIGGII